MRALIFIFIVAISMRASGQEFLNNDSVPLMEGIYKNLDELKTNSPSVPLYYPVVRKRHTYGVLIDQKVHVTYQLAMSSAQFEKLGWYFGFCDGQNIYINPDPVHLNKNTDFERLEILKPLAYFERIKIEYYPNGNPFGFNSNRVMLNVPFVFDIPSGSISELTPDLVNEMIWKDSTTRPKPLPKRRIQIPQVYDNISFQNNSTLKNYLLSFYKKNASCATSLREHMGILALIDFIKEQSVDANCQTYYDRVMGELQNNPFFTKVTLQRTEYTDGKSKHMGIVAFHNDVPYKIGVWSYFDKAGRRIKTVEYNINAGKIRVSKLR